MKNWAKRIPGVRIETGKGSKMQRSLTSSRENKDASVNWVLQAVGDRRGDSAEDVRRPTHFVDLVKTFVFYVNTILCNRKQEYKRTGEWCNMIYTTKESRSHQVVQKNQHYILGYKHRITMNLILDLDF